MKNKTVVSIIIVLAVIAILILAAYSQQSNKKTEETPENVLNGQATELANPGSYTASEVAMHADASSCWTIIQNEVYDLTSWIGRHPGGQEAILSICGKDGTSLFEGQHGGQEQPENTLANFKIGTLQK